MKFFNTMETSCPTRQIMYNCTLTNVIMSAMKSFFSVNILFAYYKSEDLIVTIHVRHTGYIQDPRSYKVKWPIKDSRTSTRKDINLPIFLLIKTDCEHWNGVIHISISHTTSWRLRLFNLKTLNVDSTILRYLER